MRILRSIYIIATAALILLNTELDFGVCLNNQGDGKIYNADAYYNYISYRSTEAQEGDKVLTLFFKNPTNLECDDYIYRHDWIITR